MSIQDYILTILIQSLFCLGLRTVMSDGMIFHFIRHPFERNSADVMNFMESNIKTHNQRILYRRMSDRLSFFLKPVLLCVICFSSFWGSIVFIVLNGLIIVPLIICCISTAFILKIVNDKIDF